MESPRPFLVVLALLASPHLAAAQPGGPARPAVEAPTSDHERVVGRLGVSWFGVSEIPIGVAPRGGQALAPALGARYWLSELVGVDLGVGVVVSASSGESEQGNQTEDVDGPTTTGFLVHAGLPLALAHAGHFTFLVTPEVNVGYAETSLDDEPGPPGVTERTVDSGFRLDVGARVGSEIHFGFIGIPSLSLEASVGVLFQHLELASSTEISGPGVPASDSRESRSVTRFTTTVTNDPWDIFRASVAARYYF